MIKYGFIAAACVAAFAGCGFFSGKTVATVNGEKISTTELKQEMGMERNKYDPAVLSDESNFVEFRKQALGKLIQEEILLAEAKRLNLKITPEEQKEFEMYRSDIIAQGVRELGLDMKVWERKQKNRIIIGKLIQQEVVEPIPVSDDKIEAYFKSHAKEFNQPAQFHARQILTDTQETADEALAKLSAGEKFEEVAKRFSQTPDAKNGGDLGFFDSRSHPQVFSDICSKLRPEETSGVTKTEYGFQIFQLIEKRDARKIPFEEAAPMIKRELKEDKSEEAFASWMDELSKNANISVDEKVLGEVALEKKS